MIRRVYLLFSWLLTNALSARPKPNPYGLRVPNDPVRYQPEAAHHPDPEPVDVREYLNQAIYTTSDRMMALRHQRMGTVRIVRYHL